MMTLSTQVHGGESLREPAEAPPAEAALIRETLDGNSQAFAQIVNLHSRRVFNYLYQMTRQRQDAEDLAQQTFIKAYNNLHRFDTTRPLTCWLLTIARRTALNHFRAAKRWESVPEDAACDRPSPANQAEGHDRVENLWAHARRVLSQREFEVLWLRFAEELSVEETARIAGLTQTHVKILVFRARKRLVKIQATT